MRRILAVTVVSLACARTQKGTPSMASGDSLYASGDFARARTAYRNELRRADRGDVEHAHLLTSIALSAYWVGDYDEARRVGDSALALVSSSAPIAEAFRVHNALGLIAWKQGRLAAADSFFHNALRLAKAAHDTAGIAKASANLALVFTDYGEFQSARAALIAARDAAHAMGNARVEGNAYTNLAMLDLRTGDLVDAEDEVTRALTAYRAAHYDTGTQNALGQLATIEDARGDPRSAFATIDSALLIVRRQGLKEEEASDLEILGDLYAEAGDLRSAALYYDQAEREFSASGNELEAANLMRGRADVDAAHADTASARARVSAALAVHTKLGARAEELNDRLAMAELGWARELDGAPSLDSAARLADSLGSQSVRVRSVLARASYEERLGRPRDVLRVLTSEVPDPRALDRASRWEIAALRLRAWARIGRLDSAEAAGREAVRLIERSRGSYGSAELRTTYTARMAQVYTDLVLVLLRKGDIAGAFAIADAARGRALVEHLAAARAQLSSNSAPALFVDAEQLASRIDSLVARLDAVDRGRTPQRSIEESAIHRDLAERLAQARSEYEATVKRAESDEDAALLGLTPMDAARVQASLAPDEAVLDYLVTPDTLLTFVVTRREIRIARTFVRESDVAARARVVRELAGARTSPTNGTPAAQALYDLLIAPAERTGALTGVSRLIISPHEALTYVPFAALQERTSGKALVERYVLTYLPSAAALPVLRERKAILQQGSRSHAPAAIALAPFTTELPATAAEARRFAARVPNGQILLGADATERALRAALASGEIVHVATHAELNLRNPMFSEIRLAPGNGGRNDDGRLEVHEIFGLRVRSELVFLSGCETGAGGAWATDFQRGEDYATLSRAFLYAGARNVIATLWPIDDAGAAELADRFYAHRGATDDAQALAEAQREMMHDPRFRAPYYWAAYQLSGAGR
ncbi:MAG TPA: CHAT domain-containing protein [Gemmatimonadaceae bacterium]